MRTGNEEKRNKKKCVNVKKGARNWFTWSYRKWQTTHIPQSVWCSMVQSLMVYLINGQHTCELVFQPQKQKFPIWKSRLSSSYTIPSVTVYAQSGRHFHRHLHVSCADRMFSAAAGLPVCRPCSVNLPQKSVQCWTKPVLVRKFLQLSGAVTLRPTLP